MTHHRNFEKSNCWSCEFFSGAREFKQGLFSGNSVTTEKTGTCVNRKSREHNQSVDENHRCSRYQKWNVIQSYRATQEQRAQKNDFEDYRNQQIIALENERKAIEEEREKFRIEKWLSTLTPDELRKYNEEQARKKVIEFEEEQLFLHKKRVRLLSDELPYKEKELKKLKNRPFIGGLIIVLLTSSFFLPTLRFYLLAREGMRITQEFIDESPFGWLFDELEMWSIKANTRLILMIVFLSIGLVAILIYEFLIMKSPKRTELIKKITLDIDRVKHEINQNQ